MGLLFNTVRRLVLDRRYIVGSHAVERLDERGILEWHIIEGAERAKLLRERPNDRPNPVVEMRQLLPDGSRVRVVWSYLASVDMAKRVTVYFSDD